MSVMKPTKPEPFDGQRDALKVNTWLYKMEVYFGLLVVGNNQLTLDDQTKMNFASTLLTGTASNWWYMKVMGQATPTSWNDFKATVVAEFVPFDHLRRTRDKLRNLVQHNSVARCLN